MPKRGIIGNGLQNEIYCLDVDEIVIWNSTWTNSNSCLDVHNLALRIRPPSSPPLYPGHVGGRPCLGGAYLHHLYLIRKVHIGEGAMCH
jgi:hypothetical protein